MIRRPRKSRIVLALLLAGLGGCASSYRMVTAGETRVAGMTVRPGSTWNRLPAGMSEAGWEEVWTRNGPQVERLAFIGRLPDGAAITIQKKNADQQVPVFRADMMPHDLTSMVEVSYRVNGVAVFDLESVEPVDFLEGPGLKVRFNYASGIGIAKKGRWVMRVVDDELYVMKLEGVAGQYFDEIGSEFDRLVASAKLSK
jgi:hypothetical protein